MKKTDFRVWGKKKLIEKEAKAPGQSTGGKNVMGNMTVKKKCSVRNGAVAGLRP